MEDKTWHKPGQSKTGVNSKEKKTEQQYMVLTFNFLIASTHMLSPLGPFTSATPTS